MSPSEVAIMDTNVLKTAAATWARLLAFGILLAALALAGGVACGGDDDERDSRSSRSSDRETSSNGESEAREDDEDDEDEDEDEDRDSSSSLGSDRTGRGVSVQDLGSVPNLQYDRLVLVDVSALLYGDVP